LLRHHARDVRSRVRSSPFGLSGECCERAEPSPDSFPTDIPQPNVNERPLTWSYFTEIIRFYCGGPRSGRGGRRFKSCHSDQISSGDAEFPQLSAAPPNFEASCAKACAAYADACCGWFDLAAALKRIIEGR